MKPWNAWVASLGCAGLCLALVGCGGSKDPETDLGAMAAQGGVATPPPSSAPPAAAEPETPAPVAEAPAPEPAPPAAAETAAAPTPEGAPAPADSAAMTKPEGETSPATPGGPAPANPGSNDAVPGNPAMAANAPAGTADATAAPTNPAPSEPDNPFAVFSESTPSTPAPNATPPPAGSGEASTEAASTEPPAPAAEGDRGEGNLGYLNTANIGDRGASTKKYHSPITAATAFLEAVKAKDLPKIAEATALRAPLEAKSTTNQKLFAAILAQDLAQEDLDEFAKKLEGFQLGGSNVPKSSGQFGVIVVKNEGNSTLRRTIILRHEKAGWKVMDISGQGEITRPQFVRPGMGGRRR